MNEITPKADIQIAVLVDEATLLLFGWIDRALPSSGTARFSETRIRGFRGTRGKTPGNDICIVSSCSRISLNLNS
jgi:hypothetical protein